MEGEVSEIRSYQSEAIDGRLQTEAYIRALMLADVEVPTQDELDRRVGVRLKRQEQMMGEDGPKMWMVLNEGTLRRTVGLRQSKAAPRAAGMPYAQDRNSRTAPRSPSPPATGTRSSATSSTASPALPESGHAWPRDLAAVTSALSSR